MKLNEFTAKKLGEVLAFAKVGAETWEKGQEAAEEGLSWNIPELIQALESEAGKIEALAKEAGVHEKTVAKCEATSTKLRAMRDLYIADAWDNPTELLEWSGFFEGATIVHWNLVSGAADASEHRELKDLAFNGHKFHYAMLEEVEARLKKIGRERASE